MLYSYASTPLQRSFLLSEGLGLWCPTNSDLTTTTQSDEQPVSEATCACTGVCVSEREILLLREFVSAYICCIEQLIELLFLAYVFMYAGCVWGE